MSKRHLALTRCSSAASVTPPRARCSTIRKSTVSTDQLANGIAIYSCGRDSVNRRNDAEIFSFRFTGRAVAGRACARQLTAVADQAMSHVIDHVPDLARRQIVAVGGHQRTAESHRSEDVPLGLDLLLVIRRQVKGSYQEFRPDQAVAGARFAMAGRAEDLKEFPPMVDRLVGRRIWIGPASWRHRDHARKRASWCPAWAPSASETAGSSPGRAGV